MSPLPRLRALSPLAFAAWIATLLIVGGLMILLHGLPVKNSDFWDFYLAARTLATGGDPYAPQPSGLQGFFNPLWAAFPFLPLVALSPENAFALWQLLLLVMLVAAARPLFPLYGVRPTPGTVLLTAWLFLIPWFVGQNAPLVATGAFLAITFGARQRWARAGAMAPLLAIKPHTVLLLPLLMLVRGRQRVVRGGLLSMGLALLLSFVILPGWLSALLGSRWAESQQGAGESWPASSFLNLLEWAGLPNGWYLVLLPVAGAILWVQRRRPWREQAAVALAVGVLVAPYVRAGDFPLLLPLFLLIPAGWRQVVGTLALSLFLVGLPVALLWLIPALLTGAYLLWRYRAEGNKKSPA